jgi:N-acetylglucosaminyldiphosphoundecaprenol N-acetyl-beta-D-mannosaminyltransferase
MAPRNLKGPTAGQRPDSENTQPGKLGFCVSALRMPETISAIREFITSDTPHLVVTADAASAVLARRDRLYLDIVRKADLVTPDGTGIVLACRLLGEGARERICGVDLVPEIAQCCAYERRSLFLIGGRPGVAEEAARELKRRFPALQIAGCHHGYFDAESESGVVEMIARTRPDVLVAGMGAPKQEKWLAENAAAIGAKLAIGVGGSLDVLAGRSKRAPRWMQRAGIEWLWRFVSDPKRVRKVALLPAFCWIVLRGMVQRRGKGSA